MIHHDILGVAYRPLLFAKKILSALGASQRDHLRVLIYHDIAPSQRDMFLNQLLKLQENWSFITPSQFESIVSGGEPVKGRKLLLTFDDGFASNRIVADQILAPLGIKALFFVVSDFIAIDERGASRAFIAEHILPGSQASQLPPHLENMHWSDLEALIEQGHYIGAHTRTHRKLSECESFLELESEIVSSADFLENKLGISINHFAYTFGDLASFSPDALSVAAKRFGYIYSGLRGNNARNASPQALRRDAIDSNYPLALMSSFVEGFADFRYRKSINRLSAWVDGLETQCAD